MQFSISIDAVLDLAAVKGFSHYLTNPYLLTYDLSFFKFSASYESIFEHIMIKLIEKKSTLNNV